MHQNYRPWEPSLPCYDKGSCRDWLPRWRRPWFDQGCHQAYGATGETWPVEPLPPAPRDGGEPLPPQEALPAMPPADAESGNTTNEADQAPHVARRVDLRRLPPIRLDAPVMRR